MKLQEQAVTLKWTFEGDAGLALRVGVVEVEGYLPDGTVVRSEPTSVGIQGNGQNSVGLNKRNGPQSSVA